MLDLHALTKDSIVALGCALNGGTFGCDPARKTKADCVAHVMSLADGDVIEATWQNMNGARPVAAVPEPKAEAQPIPERVAARAATAVADEDAAAKQLAEALRAIVGNPPAVHKGVDEEAVRAIATDVARDVTAGEGFTRHIETLAREVCDARMGERENAMVARVADAIEEAVAALGHPTARPLDLSGIGGVPELSMAGRHPIFELVLRLAALPHDKRPNILLVGPAGCGKSTLAKHLAEALQRPFASISLSAGVTEAALTCRVLPVHDGGRFGAVDSEFLRLYGQPSVVLLDEMDAADPNVLLVANAATANGGFHVEARAVDNQPTYVERSPENVILAAANTYGTGATAQYVGRGALDAATLDRYLVIEMGYDDALEASIAGIPLAEVTRWLPSASTDPEAVRADIVKLHAWIKDARAKAAAAGLQRILSTRAIQKAIALRMVGCSIAETKARLLAGWREDELAAIGYEVEPWDGKVSLGEIADFTELHDHAPGMTCPRCSAPMVKRVAKFGERAGKPFYGCTAFPNCRGTRPIEDAA